MISDTLFLETLLCQLRGQIIKFSKKNKKRGKERREHSLYRNKKNFKSPLTQVKIVNVT